MIMKIKTTMMATDTRTTTTATVTATGGRGGGGGGQGRSQAIVDGRACKVRYRGGGWGHALPENLNLEDC